jgi:hypothetical protein
MKILNCFIYSIYLIGLLLVEKTIAQCPWHRDVPDLQTSCLCAYNLGQELSVQCDQVSNTFLSFFRRPISY